MLTYPFIVKGLNASGIGVSTLERAAEIFNLKSLSDFSGIYGAAGVGGAIGRIGAGTGGLANTKGIHMHLNTHSKCLELLLAISGVNIDLDPRYRPNMLNFHSVTHQIRTAFYMSAGCCCRTSFHCLLE